ncbi:MAG: Mrp/NBP35 family ATP-binding protein [Bacteroidales bacterium]|nr:Mrp/NBP35 family ATP-binding protein [Bacteroidales bacterium]
MHSQEQLREVLKTVKYPGKEDIVSMGMIEKAEHTADGIVIVLKTDRQKDPVASSLKHACVKALKDAFGPDTPISSIEIKGPGPEVKTKAADPDLIPGVKNIIAVASGKGGVGKSTIAVNTAVALARQGYATGLLDADIFGPSAPKMFDTENERPQLRKEGEKELVLPVEKYGVKVLSVGYFVSQEDAVVWRGPMASNFLKQLLGQGDWGELDYLIVDLPPGTSDIHLTLVQEVGVTGVVIVSTPQKVALADAIKGISMFRNDKINVPVLGLVENMAWFTPAELPDNKYYIFGREGCKQLAEEMNIPLLGQIPIVQGICESGDSGKPVALENDATGRAFEKLAKELVARTEERNRNTDPTQKVHINK